MTKAQILIKEVWEDLNLVNPVTIGQRLDERLDEAVINIKGSALEYIQPTTRVRLITNAEAEIEQYNYLYFIVANDKSVELPIGSKNYNHELSLIEATKLLEGIQCQTLTFTNSNDQYYGKDIKKAFFTPSGWASLVNYGEKYVIPEGYNIGSSSMKETHSSDLELPTHDDLSFNKEPVTDIPNINLAWVYWRDAVATQSVKDNKADKYILVIKDINGNKAFEYNGEGADGSNNKGEKHKIKFHKYGLYQAIYTWKIENTAGFDIEINYTYQIAVVKYYNPLQKWNCKDVVNRILNLAEPLFGAQQKPRFKLYGDWAEKLEKILAPEFSMTSANLREQLKQVGGMAHAEPRLKDFETVTFDKYGDNEVVTIDKPYISQGFGGNINDYAVQIDTYAENLVNASSEIAIVEPFGGGYRSLRTEEVNVRVNETNGVIQTTFPIYAIKEVKVKTDDGFIDITKYVFESTLYNSQLSPFEGVYPYSQCYGIYYTMGKKNITGLFYKAPAVIGQAYKKFTIVNILEREGVSPSTNYPTYKFVVSYLPIYNTRFRHGKGYLEATPSQYTQVYNQTENLIETKYYGENIKGVSAKMGNAELTRTYFFDKYADIPQLGKNLKIGEELYKITAIDTAISGNRCKTTLSLSKHYNNISPYVGINSIRRFSEVSERQAYARQIVLPTYCIIGRDSDAKENDTSISIPNGINALKQIFIREELEETPINEVTVAKVQHVSQYGETKGDAIVVPVISSAFGNCATFTFGFTDNYSAGQFVRHLEEGEVSGYWQTDVPYADFYGNIEALSVGMYQKALKFEDKDAFALPLLTDENDFVTAEIMTANAYIIDKDSREIPQITMSLEFKTTAKDIIIGSGLAKRLPFIKQSDLKDAEVYVIPPTIKKENSVIDNDFVVGEFDNVIDVGYLLEQKQLKKGEVSFEEKNGKLGIIIASELGVRETNGWLIVTPRQEHTRDVTKRDGTIASETYYTGGELILASRKPLKDQLIYSLDYITLHFTNNI